MAKIHAARASALVGVPFRPQGRDLNGLDCVGLAIMVFDLPEALVRNDYRLHGQHWPEAMHLLPRFFRRVEPGKARAGDLLLFAPRDDQLHFAVLTSGGYVHAHAGLRRVVETPGYPEWPPMDAFRRRTRKRII